MNALIARRRILAISRHSFRHFSGLAGIDKQAVMAAEATRAEIFIRGTPFVCSDEKNEYDSCVRCGNDCRHRMALLLFFLDLFYRLGRGGGLKPSHMPSFTKSDISPVARSLLGALLYSSLASTGHELWSIVASRTSM